MIRGRAKEAAELPTYAYFRRLMTTIELRFSNESRLLFSYDIGSIFQRAAHDESRSPFNDAGHTDE